MQTNFRLVYFLMLVAVFGSCKKDFDGSKNAINPPETYMVVDSIYRTGADRLTTRVQANWWGISSGGFVVAYEVSIDNMATWTRTKRQDSVILLKITSGVDTANVKIFVRAIDNLGQIDPTPAGLTYPIKNSPPKLFVSGIPGKKPVNCFPAVRFLWTVSDTDGQEDIQRFEVFLNDTTTPYQLAGNITDITLIGDLADADSAAFVYTGIKTKALDTKLKSIKYNAWNYLYVQAFDRANSKSNRIKDSVFIRKPAGEVLIINAFTSAKLDPENLMKAQLNTLTKTYDVLQINEYDGNLKSYTELSPDPLTQSRVFGFYKKIIWFSNDPDFTLSLAQLSTTNFFDNGGHMFMFCEVNSSYPDISDYLNFTPAESLISPPPGTTGFRMLIADSVKPHKAGWPLLTAGSSILSNIIRPFNIPQFSSGAFTYDSLYKSNLIYQAPGVTNWTGNSNVVAKRSKAGKTDFIFTTLPVNRLVRDANLNQFFNKVLIDELAF